MFGRGVLRVWAHSTGAPPVSAMGLLFLLVPCGVCWPRRRHTSHTLRNWSSGLCFPLPWPWPGQSIPGGGVHGVRVSLPRGARENQLNAPLNSKSGCVTQWMTWGVIPCRKLSGRERCRDPIQKNGNLRTLRRMRHLLAFVRNRATLQKYCAVPEWDFFCCQCERLVPKQEE